MDHEGYKFPDDLYYLVVVGVTDYAQKLAGTVKRVQTLEEDDEVEQHKPFGTMSTGKWTGKLYSPVGGEIAAVNEEVEETPANINSDPYGKGWLMKIRVPDQGQLAQLMHVGTDPFKAWFAAERAKHGK